MVSDTPRTDVESFFMHHSKYDYCKAGLARQLERELNAANKRISYLEEAVQDSIDACDRDIGILQQRMSNLKLAKEAKP